MTARRGGALLLAAAVMTAALAACGSAPKESAAIKTVTSAPVRIANTGDGPVGYRSVGSGPPLVLIMGYGLTMEAWDPRLVHALAAHHRVVMFDNSGIGRTRQLPEPESISAMAGQTSALITTLGLGRPDVLGWSEGGTVAQALAVLHPAQVHHLVLCATFPGNGEDNARQATGTFRNDFPANQGGAYSAYEAAVGWYPDVPKVSGLAKGQEIEALSDWWVGNDAAGRDTPRIAAPTLVADGAEDTVDPQANDHVLASLISGAQLKFYPDAGHAFLFQDWDGFASAVNSFLG